jgi:TetR/AcrR family transcriptional repressor of mexJK operon
MRRPRENTEQGYRAGVGPTPPTAHGASAGSAGEASDSVSESGNIARAAAHPDQDARGGAPEHGRGAGGDTGNAGSPPVIEARSARKRRGVVEAATALFLRHGYLGTSMDQIAASSAVSKPTVYRFFADKEQLFTEIVLGALDRAGDPFRARVAALAGTEDLAADLPRLARRYVATVTQPVVLQLRRMVIGSSPQLPDLARAYYERAPEQTIRALARCFEQLAARGLLTIDDPEVAASHFAFLVLGRALDKSLFCGDSPFSDAQLAAQADAGASAFLAVYGRAGSPGPADGARPSRPSGSG